MDRAKDMKGNWVEGYHCKVEGKHYIIPEDAYFESLAYYEYSKGLTRFIEINPLTLGRDTTVKDKNGKPIYGSFEYEPGKMSEGGDIYEDTLTIGKRKVVWGGTGWCGECIEDVKPACQIVGQPYKKTLLGDRSPLRYDTSTVEIIGPACDVKENK